MPLIFGAGLCALASAAVLRPLFLLSAPPAYLHDWIWPVSTVSLDHVSWLVTSAWVPQDLGAPNSDPSLAPLLWFAVELSKLAGPRFALDAWMFAVGTAASCGAMVLARSVLAAGWAVAACCGVAYVASPGFSNELIAGHFGDLVAYAAFPWFLMALIAYARVAKFLTLIMLCATAALCTVAVQFIFLCPLVIAIFWAVYRRRRLGLALLAASFFLLLANGAVIGHGIVAGTDYGIFERQRAVLEWELAQSAPLALALHGAGYIAGYDLLFLRGFLWSGFSGLALYLSPLLLLIAGLPRYRTRRAFLAAAAVYVAGVVVLSGLRGPLSAPLAWMFVHLRATSLLRELYHAVPMVALPLALAFAAAVALAAALRMPFARYALTGCALVFLFGFAAAPLFGVSERWFGPAAFRDDPRLEHALAAAGAGRIALSPGRQPVRAFAGGSIGVDPRAYYPLGERWPIFAYESSGVPVLAADLLRAGRLNDAVQVYRRMSAGAIVLRARPEYGIEEVTRLPDRLQLARTPKAPLYSFEIISPRSSPVVYGAGPPLLVGGDYARLLEPRLQGRTLAFMRQSPPFVRSGGFAIEKDASPIDRSIAYGCSAFTGVAASTLRSDPRSAWVPAYRHGYADVALDFPLSPAVVTAARHPALAQRVVLRAILDGAGKAAYAWGALPDTLAPGRALAVAGAAIPVSGRCTVPAVSPASGGIAVLRTVRNFPTMIRGQLRSRGESATLVLTDAFNERWVLSVDGAPVDARAHFAANGFSNGWVLHLSPGAHDFTIEYTLQRFFAALLWIETASWFCLAILALATFGRTSWRTT